MMLLKETSILSKKKKKVRTIIKMWSQNFLITLK